MNESLEQIRNRIDELMSQKERVIVAIDGNCTAGKTSLAGRLAELYDCNVIHMDDFFLRPEQRTPERYAEVGGNVAGYVGVYRVGDEADITNVAVSSIYRRKGIGKSLLRELISYSQKQNILAITLEVRDSNAGAIALYEQMGFNKVGIRKNFYEKPVEDAIIYQYIFSQK